MSVIQLAGGSLSALHAQLNLVCVLMESDPASLSTDSTDIQIPEDYVSNALIDGNHELGGTSDPFIVGTSDPFIGGTSDPLTYSTRSL